MPIESSHLTLTIRSDAVPNTTMVTYNDTTYEHWAYTDSGDGTGTLTLSCPVDDDYKWSVDTEWVHTVEEEAVARAICTAVGMEPDRKAGSGALGCTHRWQEFLPEARAAIRAIDEQRNPTPAPSASDR